MNYQALLSGDAQAARPALKEFVQQFGQKFSTVDQWPELWRSMFSYLEQDDLHDMVQDCLSAIRILSRDKTHLEESITEKNIRILLRLANIDANPVTPCNDLVIVEALKCLCNLVFNSEETQRLFEKFNGVDGILKRVRSYKENSVKYEVQFFDMKLLFLITALNSKARDRVREELNGCVYLTELIDVIVQERSVSGEAVWFEDRDIDLLCEILKVLFNLTSNTGDSAEANELQFSRLAGVLRNTLISVKTSSREKRLELHSNLVNLVSCIPNVALDKLVPNLVRGGGCDTPVEFEDHDVTVLATFLDFLRLRLESVSRTGPVSSEKLGPILTVLVRCSRHHRIQRRYIRSVILPPLTNPLQRPEEGTEVKNILCRLLTSVNTQVRDLVAELMFICCKESVARMAKHTGYGNSLGMFASRGLLGSERMAPSQEYSSDSDTESDTEEYRRLEHGINPVTGCYEPPRPNPFENMSDEQKEYEALKLVNLIDQLDRKGIIKPARIGADGKPEAVDHVLQLQEATEVPKPQGE